MELNPLFINSHTGRDIFTLAQNKIIYDLASKLEKEHNITVCHETHRGRATSSLPATLALIQAYPELKLTADYSHWTCVHESLLEDQQESLASITPHIHHIHARVGNAQSPQVSDPRLPEHKEALQTHLNFWKKIIHHRQQRGENTTTITVEFGPPPYFTDTYQAEKLWEINCWIKQLLELTFQR